VQPPYGPINDGSSRRARHAFQIVNEDIPLTTPGVPPIIVWFRDDLRLSDHPALHAAATSGAPAGVMDNRVRMVVASFLVKHLLIDWREGEAWFWDTLVDADAGSNPANWQWVAGCGADAAPYFRVFNPQLQGEKFDPDGIYVRRWVPELKEMPAKLIHRPWQARPIELASVGVTLGKTYPHPIIDHTRGRERALAAYAKIRKG
jgi:deoxyribodipyrimidine photo-lyase